MDKNDAVVVALIYHLSAVLHDRKQNQSNQRGRWRPTVPDTSIPPRSPAKFTAQHQHKPKPPKQIYIWFAIPTVETTRTDKRGGSCIHTYSQGRT